MNTSPKSRLTRPVYLSASVRSPFGKFGGSLKRFTAPELATLVLKSCIERSPSREKSPDYVFMGHARQAGSGPNPARQATIFSGLSNTVPAVTFNQACASGLAAIISACEKIQLGRAEKIYAGGVESMSNTPYLSLNARWGNKMGNMKLLDGMIQDGFLCPMSKIVMGETVEKFLVPEFGISRKEQDDFALLSQQKADRAWSQGLFASEVVAIPGDGPKNPGLSDDEHRRGDTTTESLAKLAPVFDAKTGTITAGNSSGIVDGAAFLEVSSSAKGAEAEILDYEITGVEPERMGIGPITAVQNLLKRNSLNISDIEVFELNEAFAAQVLACNRVLKIPMEKINPRGGSIAIGHPIGATGARITVTLIHQLKAKPGALGVATLCVSGGMGVALLIRAA